MTTGAPALMAKLTTIKVRLKSIKAARKLVELFSEWSHCTHKNDIKHLFAAQAVSYSNGYKVNNRVFHVNDRDSLPTTCPPFGHQGNQLV